jgi:hypothetical protein
MARSLINRPNGQTVDSESESESSEEEHQEGKEAAEGAGEEVAKN